MQETPDEPEEKRIETDPAESENDSAGLYGSAPVVSGPPTPCGLETPHGRHQLGVAGGTCPGVAERPPLDDLGTYESMFDQYRRDQRHWIGPAQLPLVFHIRKLCRKLDADPDAPASLSSAYLQALHRLERQRPGSKEPAGAAGDLPGQGSIFDELD
jgi:hypothetical protein